MYKYIESLYIYAHTKPLFYIHYEILYIWNIHTYMDIITCMDEPCVVRKSCHDFNTNDKYLSKTHDL